MKKKIALYVLIHGVHTMKPLLVKEKTRASIMTSFCNMIFHLLGVSTPTGARCKEIPRVPHGLLKALCLPTNNQLQIIEPMLKQEKENAFSNFVSFRFIYLIFTSFHFNFCNT